ncbi:ZIP family metal transporter, partial [Candidatus Roizmanbacteria bacterium]|nr:ZIP family metal transporter [Candidatus Roizmanbacteria bacterium]
MNVLSSIIIASVAVSLISLIGGLLLIWKKLFTQKFTLYSVAFAAGVMLTTAFIDLLPEALENNKSSNIFVYGLLGIVIFFLIERFVLWFHHHDEAHTKPSAYLVLLGDGLHNFFDGIAIAAAFLSNPGLGFVTTLAIAAHEIPQEVADF